jgi:hypothetical protein
MSYYKNLICLIGTLLFGVVIAAQETNATSVSADAPAAKPTSKKQRGKSALSELPYNDNDEGFQLIGGVEQSGFASLTNQTGPFLSVFTPAGLDTNWKAWGRIRLLGAPSASTGGVVAALQDPTGQIKNLDTQQVGRAVDFMVGPDFQIPKLTSKSGRYSMHLIGGVGATTPLSSQDVIEKFAVPAKGSQQCNEITSRFTPQNGYPANLILPNPANTADCLANGITVLAFNPQERSSFLRKYSFGIRTIDRILEGSEQKCCERGIVDFTFGQDEGVTGGSLHGWVFRLDGTHPLPIKDMSFLYLFGTAAIRITRNHDLQTLVLAPDSSNAIPSSANVALLPVKQPNKDFYRFGVGLDVKKLFTKLFGSGTAPTTSSATDSQAERQTAANSKGKSRQ